jgi:hypothetical protein
LNSDIHVLLKRFEFWYSCHSEKAWILIFMSFWKGLNSDIHVILNGLLKDGTSWPRGTRWSVSNKISSFLTKFWNRDLLIINTQFPHCLVHVLFKVTRIMTWYVFINNRPQSEESGSPYKKKEKLHKSCTFRITTWVEAITLCM